MNRIDQGNPESDSNTKHLATKLHHFQSYVNSGEISVHKIDTSLQPADVLTKPLNSEWLKRHRKTIMGWQERTYHYTRTICTYHHIIDWEGVWRYTSPHGCDSQPNDSPTSRSNQSTNLTTTLIVFDSICESNWSRESGIRFQHKTPRYEIASFPILRKFWWNKRT